MEHQVVYTEEQVREIVGLAYAGMIGIYNREDIDRVKKLQELVMERLASLSAPKQEAEKKGVDLESLQARFDALFNEPDAEEQFWVFVEKKRAQEPNQYDAMREKMETYFNHPDCAERLLAAASPPKEEEAALINPRWIKCSDREPSIGHYYYCKVDTKQDSIESIIVEWAEFENGINKYYDWDLENADSDFGEDAEVIEWLDESAPNSAPTVDPHTYREALTETFAGILYKMKTDEADNGSWISDKDFYKVAAALSSSVSAPTGELVEALRGIISRMEYRRDQLFSFAKDGRLNGYNNSADKQQAVAEHFDMVISDLSAALASFNQSTNPDKK